MIYTLICLYSVFKAKMSKGTKKRGNGWFNVKIIEVCGFYTNYGVEAPSIYAVALTYEDYDIAQHTATT